MDAKIKKFRRVEQLHLKNSLRLISILSSLTGKKNIVEKTHTMKPFFVIFFFFATVVCDAIVLEKAIFLYLLVGCTLHAAHDAHSHALKCVPVYNTHAETCTGAHK